MVLERWFFWFLTFRVREPLRKPIVFNAFAQASHPSGWLISHLDHPFKAENVTFWAKSRGVWIWCGIKSSESLIFDRFYRGFWSCNSFDFWLFVCTNPCANQLFSILLHKRHIPLVGRFSIWIIHLKQKCNVLSKSQRGVDLAWNQVLIILDIRQVL